MHDIQSLLVENAALIKRIAHLESELEFLKLHPVFAQGLKGERLIAKLSGGKLTELNAPYDISVGSSVKVEVKFSKLNCPHRGETRRWQWSKPLGWKDKGKDYDFLLLVGDKDQRFAEQYPPDNSPYVFFLIPHSQVADILTSNKAIGSNAQIISNLKSARSPASMAIKKHMVSAHLLSELLDKARIRQKSPP